MEILTARIEERQTGIPHVQQTVPDTQTALNEFMQTKERSVSAVTTKAYIRVFKRYLATPYLLSDTQGIRRNILNLVSESGLSNTTVHKHLQRLSEYFDYCISAGLCSINPLASVKKPAVDVIEPIMPTTDEVKAILEYFRSGRWFQRYPYEREMNALLVEFLSITAVRPGEALRLSSADISKDGLKIDGKRKRFNQPRVRYIPFDAIAGSREVTERVILQSKGERLFPWSNTQKPASNFRSAVLSLGLNPEYQLYSLRAYAKNWWEKELGISFDVSNLLAGHSFAVRRNYVKQPDMDAMKKYAGV